MSKSSKVTNLIQDIGRIRDLLEEKNYTKLDANTLLLLRTMEAVKTNYKKYLKDQNHFLDFNSYDLEEMCQEISDVLKEIDKKLTIKKMSTCALKYGENEFTKEYVTYFRVRAALTEFQSTMWYLATCLRMFEEGKAKVKVGN